MTRCGVTSSLCALLLLCCVANGASVSEELDGSYWGVNCGIFAFPTQQGHRILSAAAGIGFAWVRDDFTAWKSFSAPQSWVRAKGKMYQNHNLEVLGVLGYGLDKYSTKPVGLHQSPRDPTFYPPRNLFLPVSSRQNHWASYVRAVMESLPHIRYWEVWNEPNICSTYLGNPDPVWYGSRRNPIDTQRERCSLYVRMCYVARQVAASLGGGRKIVAGSVSRLTSNWYGSSGVEWIKDMLEIGADTCFDLLSVHPYQTGRFSSDAFYADLDTLNRILLHSRRQYEVWATEVGWPLTPPSGEVFTEQEVADNLCKFCASAAASRFRGSAGYGKVFLYQLHDASAHSTLPDPERFGLVGPDMELRAAGWAVQRLIRLLRGRTPVAGPVQQAEQVRVLEFQDGSGHRLWICWSENSTAKCKVLARLPVRTLGAMIEVLPYDAITEGFQVRTDADGWLRLDLDERPVFVEETGQRSRPDLVVDSVRVEPKEPRVGQRMAIRAWVRNRAGRETRATPQGMATRVLFLWEEDTLGYEQTAQQIGVGKTVEFRHVVVEAEPRMAGPALVKVAVNPEQRYVELDMGNNEAYIRAVVR